MRSRTQRYRRIYWWITTWVLKPLLFMLLAFCSVVIYISWGVIFPTISHNPKDSLALGTADAWLKSVDMAIKGAAKSDLEISVLQLAIKDYMTVSVVDGGVPRPILKRGLPRLNLTVLRKGDDISYGVYAPILFEVEDQDIVKKDKTLFILEEASSIQKTVSRGFQFLFMVSDALHIFSDSRDNNNNLFLYEDYHRILSLGKILSSTGGQRYRELVQELAIGRKIGIGLDILPQAVVEASQLFGARTPSERYLITLFMAFQSRFYVIDLNVNDPIRNEQEKLEVVRELAHLVGMKGNTTL